MSKINNKAFEQAIKSFCDKLASTNESFAYLYANDEKSIEECCSYVIEAVQRSGAVALPDNKVYREVVCYYEEDNWKPKKGQIQCKVVSNYKYVLSDEEKEEAKKVALERYISSEKEKLEKKQKDKVAKKSAEKSKVVEMSLF